MADQLGTLEIVSNWFGRVWNEGDEAAIFELFAAKGVAHGLLGDQGGPVEGPEAFLQYARAFRSAVSDLRVELLRTVVQEDLCTAHFRATGTHTGDQLGFAASGRAISFEGMVMVRTANGQIQEAWNALDLLSFYQQTGLVQRIAGTV